MPNHKWWIFSNDGGKNYTITNNPDILPPTGAAPLQQPPNAQSVQALRNGKGVKSVSILKRIFGAQERADYD